MTEKNFRSDNVAPIHPKVMEAIVAANRGPAPSYGADGISERLAEIFGHLFGAPVAVLPVATGTAANALALAALADPGARFYCHEDAHIAVAEEGAPEFFVEGGACVPVSGAKGLIDEDALRAVLRSARPGVLSLTQVSEWGTVYPPDRIARLAETGRAAGLRVHMDGARFANAVAALACAPSAVTIDAGVDALVFGTSKCGTLNAEALILFEPGLADRLPALRKRSGHAYSKMRYLSAQLEAFIADGLWLALAGHANAMARRLADGLADLPDVSLLAPTDGNMVFAAMPCAMIERLRSEGFGIEAWRGGTVVRLVTSYATTEADVDALCAAALA